MKKISIIVPCYNAEKYIDICINSLINQTIGIAQLELIFVNDASTDNTLEKLSWWEQKYPESILVVDCKENGKQGRARNIGLCYATSEYVGFSDNDDIAEPCMFENLYQKAVEYNCDMVVCGSKKHGINQLETTVMGRTGENDCFLSIENEEDRKLFLDKDINIAIWNKIYKKSIITENNLSFPEGYIYDDICFSELIKHYVSRVYILEESLYHHIVRADGASFSTKDWINKIGWFDVQMIKIQELKDRGIYNRFTERYEKEFFIDYFALIKNLVKTYGYIYPEVLNAMNNKIIEMFPEYMKIPIVRMLLEYDGKNFYRIVCESLKQEIDMSYIQKLAAAIK